MISLNSKDWKSLKAFIKQRIWIGTVKHTDVKMASRLFSAVSSWNGASVHQSSTSHFQNPKNFLIR